MRSTVAEYGECSCEGRSSRRMRESRVGGRSSAIKPRFYREQWSVASGHVANGKRKSPASEDRFPPNLPKVGLVAPGWIGLHPGGVGKRSQRAIAFVLTLDAVRCLQVRAGRLSRDRVL